MEKKIEKQSLKIISKLPYLLNIESKQKEWGNQFMVAYFIITTMALKKSNKLKIYREEIADHCNFKDVRSVSKITDKIHKSKVILKSLVGDAEQKKTYNIYSLNWDFILLHLGKLNEIDELSCSIERDNDVILSSCTGLKKGRIKDIKKKDQYMDQYINKNVDIECNTLEEKPKLFKESCEPIDEEPTVDDFDYTSMNEYQRNEPNALIPSEKKQFNTKCMERKKPRVKPNVEELNQYLQREKEWKIASST